MPDVNPTADSGASITERLEQYLAAEDAPVTEPEHERTAPEPKAAQATEAPESDVPEQEEGPQLTTSDLAKVLGIDESALDVDDDGTIKVKTKIDGKEGAAKLNDLLKNYQIAGHAENKAREVAEAQKALQQRQQEFEQQAQQRLQYVEGLAQTAAAELMREYQSIDWQTLRAQDPGQYAALQQDFQQRNAKLQQVAQVVEQNRMAQQHQMAQGIQQRMQAEAQRLQDLIPEWKDQATFDKEAVEVGKWAVSQGIPAEVVQAISAGPLVNAAHVAVLRKAYMFDQLQKSKPAIENKVRTAPKIVKPGQTEPASAKQQADRLKLNIRKSGGKEGIAAYLLATGKV